MDAHPALVALAAVLGAAAGAAITRLLLAGRLRHEASLREERGRLEAELAAERRTAEAKLELLRDAEGKLREAFESMASEALRRNNQTFLEIARESLSGFQRAAQDDLGSRQKAIGDLVEPVQASLKLMDATLREIESTRQTAYRGLVDQVQAMTGAQERLRSETSALAQALRNPTARGRWGEIQLRRVVELAGMTEHCDFDEQAVTPDAERGGRPDLVVHLPGGRHLVVDAKVPLQAFLDAAETGDDATREAKLAEHVRQVRSHVAALAAKAYWERFPTAPDFVVMFLPGEASFMEAARRDPALLDWAFERNVLLASPTTLVAVLKAVHYGWQQQRISEGAQRVRDLGAELYDRLASLAAHLARIGAQIDRTAEAFDAAVGSFERNVVVTARKLKGLGAGSTKDVPDVESVGRTTRRLAAPPTADGDAP
jgi:DNA recombination protein RmuC